MGSLSERRYVINDLPPPTSFATKCHRHADEISRKLDTFFLEHWPFPDEAARAAFLASRCPLWGCWAFPLADDDRVEDVIKLVTLLFLLDGAQPSSSPFPQTPLLHSTTLILPPRQTSSRR
jgi:hypothetical protein